MAPDAPLVRTLSGGSRGLLLRASTAALSLTLLGALWSPVVPGVPPAEVAAAQSDTDDPASALVLPVDVDADGDGWIGTVEIALGSDPDDPASTPESVAIPPSCMNGADDDANGTADDEDPGCQPPRLIRDGFPEAGADIFESTLTLTGYELPTAAGVCTVDFRGSGPTIIDRAAPNAGADGTRTVETEMVALQLRGTVTLAPGTPCNPGDEPISFETTVIEQPGSTSSGLVTAERSGADFPAESFFDVHFSVQTPLGLLPGGPPGGAPGEPVRVTNTIASFPPYHSPANADLNPDCYEVDRAQHVHCPKPPLDHFLCYTGQFPKGVARDVMLADQFRASRTSVRAPDRFCNAVSKNALAIFDEGAHLERFRIKEGKGGSIPKRVLVQNQFGRQQLQVGRPVGLFVPSQKDLEVPPAALDHFKCYSVKGSKVGGSVTLRDQFMAPGAAVREAVAGKPVTLCNPTTKTHAGIVTPVADPEWHLVCYALKTAGSVDRDITAKNQFVEEGSTLAEPIELCVPSMKTILPPPPKPISGIATYVYLVGGPNCTNRFTVPFRIPVGTGTLYNRLIFRGDQLNALLASYPRLRVYIDRFNGYDELVLLFVPDGSKRLAGIGIYGAEQLFKKPKDLRELMDEDPDRVRTWAQQVYEGEDPNKLVRFLGMRRPYCLNRVDTNVSAEDIALAQQAQAAFLEIIGG